MKPESRLSVEHPLASFTIHTEFRPRFSDIDAFGMVNNAVFFTYFEEGRVAYLTRLGIFRPPASEVSIVIQSAQCTYLQPVQQKDLVQVHLRTGDWGNSSFNFYYAVWLPEKEILAAQGQTKAVSWHLARRKASRIPPDFLERMQKFEQGVLQEV